MLRWNNKKEMGDEPASLNVGTEVSAKYKGAFCEAKIRKVVKSVKCKVQYKNESGSVFVSDEHVKGTLLTGASVEVKQPDGKDYVDGVVVKIQDLSQYTVVFDDGDIATLRRGSLCMKSGRHFADTDTLDHLPLTHPEHFSTPVMANARGTRRRGEMSDSDSEDERKSRRAASEPDMGKVVCVELGGDKKQKSRDHWFPGLIVAPAAQDSVPIDADDEYLVRSFKDGRYYTVPKKETTEFTRESGVKVELPTLKVAVEKAIAYLDREELPPHWDRDQLFCLTVRASDSDGSDSDDDPPREIKDRFVAHLYKFMEEHNTPINRNPTVSGKEVDLYRLFKIVDKLGGFNRVSNRNQWKFVALKMGFGASQANNVKNTFKKFLLSYEEMHRKLGIGMLNPTDDNNHRSRSCRLLYRDLDKSLLDKTESSSVDEQQTESSKTSTVKVKSEPKYSTDTEEFRLKETKKEQKTKKEASNVEGKNVSPPKRKICRSRNLDKESDRRKLQVKRTSNNRKKAIEKRIKKKETELNTLRSKRNIKDRIKRVLNKLKLNPSSQVAVKGKAKVSKDVKPVIRASKPKTKETNENDYANDSKPSDKEDTVSCNSKPEIKKTANTSNKKTSVVRKGSSASIDQKSATTESSASSEKKQNVEKRTAACDGKLVRKKKVKSTSMVEAETPKKLDEGKKSLKQQSRSQVDKKPSGTSALPAKKTPAETTVKKPVAEVAVKKPPVDTMMKKQLTETSVKKLSTETMGKKQSAEATVKKQAADTTAKKQSVETNAKKALVEAAAKKLLVETTVKKPPTETMVKKPLSETAVKKSPVEAKDCPLSGLERKSSTVLVETLPVSSEQSVSIDDRKMSISVSEKLSAGVNEGAKTKKSESDSDDGKKKIPIKKQREDGSIIDTPFIEEEEINIIPAYKTICIGDKLKVYYGPTHESKVTYEAKVTNMRRGASTEYLVHYTGWNNRYDEWIQRTRIADNLSWTLSRGKRKTTESEDFVTSQETEEIEQCIKNPSCSSTGSSKMPDSPTRNTPRNKKFSKTMKKSAIRKKYSDSESSSSTSSYSDSSSESENVLELGLQRTRSLTTKHKREETEKQQRTEVVKSVEEKETEEKVVEEPQKKKIKSLKRTKSEDVIAVKRMKTEDGGRKPVMRRLMNKTKGIRDTLMKSMPRKRKIVKKVEVIEKSEEIKMKDEGEFKNKTDVDDAKNIALDSAVPPADVIQLNSAVEDNTSVLPLPVTLPTDSAEPMVIKEDESITIETEVECTEPEKQCTESEIQCTKPETEATTVDEVVDDIVHKISNDYNVLPTSEAVDSKIEPSVETLDEKLPVVTKFADDSTLESYTNLYSSIKLINTIERGPKVAERTFFKATKQTPEKAPKIDTDDWSPKEKPFTKTILKTNTEKSITKLEFDVNEKSLFSCKVQEKKSEAEKKDSNSPSKSYLCLDSIVKNEEKVINEEKNDANDVYAFSEPEPFEFKGIDDTKKLHRRSPTNIFIPPKTANTIVSVEENEVLESKPIAPNEDKSELLTQPVEEVKINIVITEPVENKEISEDIETKQTEFIQAEEEKQREDVMETITAVIGEVIKIVEEREAEEARKAIETPVSADDSEKKTEIQLFSFKNDEIDISSRKKSTEAEMESKKPPMKIEFGPLKRKPFRSEKGFGKNKLFTSSLSCFKKSRESELVELPGSSDKKFSFVEKSSHEKFKFPEPHSRKIGDESKSSSPKLIKLEIGSRKSVPDAFQGSDSESSENELKIVFPGVRKDESKELDGPRDASTTDVPTRSEQEKVNDVYLNASDIKKESHLDTLKMPTSGTSDDLKLDEDEGSELLCEETIPKSPEVSTSFEETARIPFPRIRRSDRPRSGFARLMENTPPTTPEGSTPANSPSDETCGFSNTTYTMTDKLSSNSSENDTNSDNSEKILKKRFCDDSGSSYSRSTTSCDFDSYVKKTHDRNTYEPMRKRSRYNQFGTPNADNERYEQSDGGSSPFSDSVKFVKSAYYIELDPSLDSNGRIEVLQQKFNELKKMYMSLKQEVASIDKRQRKRRRREREGRVMTRNEASLVL